MFYGFLPECRTAHLDRSLKASLLISLTAVNLALGALVSYLKLPIYLDTVGLLLATITLGFGWGLACAVLTVGVGFFVINPYLPAYVLTGVAICATTELLFRLKMFDTLLRSVISGLAIAIVSATVSAPVTTYLFGGITLSGADAVTAYFLATGKTLLNSALLAGLSSEPVDKVLVAIVVYFTLLRIPLRTAARFGLRLPSRPS
jgi:energy-coupling factor transport system substrate-specific component